MPLVGIFGLTWHASTPVISFVFAKLHLSKFTAENLPRLIACAVLAASTFPYPFPSKSSHPEALYCFIAPYMRTPFLRHPSPIARLTQIIRNSFPSRQPHTLNHTKLPREEITTHDVWWLAIPRKRITANWRWIHGFFNWRSPLSYHYYPFFFILHSPFLYIFYCLSTSPRT
jgi:hypothetical protein